MVTMEYWISLKVSDLIFRGICVFLVILKIYIKSSTNGLRIILLKIV